MSSAARVTYTTHCNTTREVEIGTLSAVFRFVLDCHVKRRNHLPNESDPEDLDNECEKHEEVGDVEQQAD
jgi:hypothetical protein